MPRYSGPRRPNGRAAILLIALVTAGASLAPRAACAEEISEEARRHFKAGVAFLQDPDGERPEEAYDEFKAAYALSKSPKVLGNLALCAMKLERDGEAIDAYKRYLMEVSDIDDDERRQINSDVAMLTASAVTVTILVDSRETHIVDTRSPVRGVPITNVYGPTDDKLEIMMRPGHHRIQAKAAGAEAEWEIDAPSGARMTHVFHLAAAPPAARPPPTSEADSTRQSKPSKLGPILTMGVGGAMLVTSAVTGIVALRRVNDVEAACPHDDCPPGYDYAAARRSVKTLVTLTDVLLVTGAVVGVAGASWFFFLGDSSKAAPPGPRTTATCTTEGCAASLRIDFQ
jgi:hypothetical protein